MSTYVPDADRAVDRIKCRRYDESCDCPACTNERRQQKVVRARGLARQATEERQRLERMLAQAKEKEAVACDAALKAEAAALGIAIDNEEDIT